MDTYFLISLLAKQLESDISEKNNGEFNKALQDAITSLNLLTKYY